MLLISVGLAGLRPKGFKIMKRGKRSVRIEISLFLKREMSITLVFWLIVFLIMIILSLFGMVD